MRACHGAACGSRCVLTHSVLCRAQVEHIVTLRNETVQLQERLKQVEADKAAVEAESDTLRQQVGSRAAAGCRQRALLNGGMEH